MMAHQVAAKAARDALFLTDFSISALPAIMAAATVIAILAAILFSRLMTRCGPAALLPSSLALSAALHIGEYFSLAPLARFVAVFAYLHVAAFGAILLSLLWSAAGEAFAPNQAKVTFPVIASIGAGGGIAGGLIAERVSSLAGSASLLILLALLHLAGALVFLILSRFEMQRSTTTQPESLSATALEAIRRTPFLRQLALFVLLSTTAAALLDFLLKAGAIDALGRGPALARFFSLFYTANQVAAFVIQARLSPWLLRTIGLGRSVTLLPATVFAGTCTLLLISAFPVVVVVRGLEAICRSSIFRSGYEVFFTPIPANEKRSVKTALDVVCDRLGDALGAGALQIILLLGQGAALAPILLICAALALVCVSIARQMDKAYLSVLEHGLRNRSVELNRADVRDATTLFGLTQSLTAVASRSAVASVATVSADPSAKIETYQPSAPDDILICLQELRSRDIKRVTNSLEDAAFDVLLIPQVIKLLAWNDAKQAAVKFLERFTDRVSGQLLDCLTDSQVDFAIRRRIPQILSRVNHQSVVQGLTAALSDTRFDVRFAVSRALVSIHHHHPELTLDTDNILAVVARELAVSKHVWEARRLLDKQEESSPGLQSVSDVTPERVNYSLQHVFSLLSLTLPSEPLKLAFRALNYDDPLSRGLGFEYLQTVLKKELFEKLNELIDSAQLNSGRDADHVLRELIAQDSVRSQAALPVVDAPSQAAPPDRSKVE